MYGYLPLSFADDLERNARWFGHVPAYVQDDRSVTHAQLLDRAKRLGSALHKAGTRRQDRVAMLSMNSIEFGEVMAATQWGSYVLAGVNWRLAPAEILNMLVDSTPSVLIFEAQYLALVQKLRPELSFVRTFLCVGAETDWAQSYETFLACGDREGPPHRAREDDIACLIYTSGTTGRPKGCIWDHRAYRLLAQVDAWLSDMEATERGLIVMPMFHIGGMVISLSIHSRGGTVYLQRQFEPAEVIRAIDRDRLTFLLLAPTMVQMVIEHLDIDKLDGGSVRTIMYSAAPMPLPVLQKALEKFGNDVFLNLYGQSEICMFALTKSQHRPNGDERERKRLRSVGNPYPNLEARVVDDDGVECPPNIAGEITARSTQMFRGYWNNHPATLETIRDGWVHTGDMGYVDEDGFLFLVDRKKDMIISGGENIYSREVEEAVLRHPAIAECAVIGIPDPKWGESVWAIITCRAGMEAPGEDEIIEFVRHQIASYKKPKKVIVTDTLPKLVTGKVDKKSLREMHGA